MLTYLKYYFSLTKSILCISVSFSAFVGFYIAGIHTPYTGLPVFLTILIVLFGVWFQSSGASALNQLFEIRADSVMSRTLKRPLPTGNLTPKTALIISIILIVSGTVLLTILSPVAAILGLVNVCLYDFVYTPLKYKSNLALMAGGLVGAIPPLMGWFAAGELTLAPSIVYFSIFMFLWQIPHFIIINMKYKDEYKNAGIVTLASSYTMSSVRIILFIWLLSACASTLFFPLSGMITNNLILLLLILLNISVIILFSILIFGDKQKGLFKSNMIIHLYLVALFILILSARF